MIGSPRLLNYRKPPVGSRLSTSHPMSEALYGAYLLGEYGAEWANSGLRNTLPLTVTVAGTHVGTGGPGAGTFVGTDGAGKIKGPNPLPADFPVSVCSRFRVTAAPSGQQGLIQIATNASDGSPLYLIDTNAGGTLLQTLVGDNAFVTIVNPLVVGQWYTQVTTWDKTAGTQNEYIGFGANAMQVASVGCTLNVTTNASIWIGDGFGNPLAVDFEFIYVWGRELKYREALDVIRDPYQMWDYAVPRQLNATGVASNKVFVPGVVFAVM